MVKAVFDTNILIDYLHGIHYAKAELERYGRCAISIITWMEVMVGTDQQNKVDTQTFLSCFDLLPLDEHVAQRAVTIRQTKRIKLPDAIVWATAQVNNCILVTRNTKDFASDEPGIRVPYSLH